MVLSVSLAVLAAWANAAASVLQRKADREEPDDRTGLAMLWDLAHKPAWIAGIAAVIVGFLLQAGALATGPIALVQPILVLELGFHPAAGRRGVPQPAASPGMDCRDRDEHRIGGAAVRTAALRWPAG